MVISFLSIIISRNSNSKQLYFANFGISQELFFRNKCYVTCSSSPLSHSLSLSFFLTYFWADLYLALMQHRRLKSVFEALFRFFYLNVKIFPSKYFKDAILTSNLDFEEVRVMQFFPLIKNSFISPWHMLWVVGRNCNLLKVLRFFFDLSKGSLFFKKRSFSNFIIGKAGSI